MSTGSTLLLVFVVLTGLHCSRGSHYSDWVCSLFLHHSQGIDHLLKCSGGVDFAKATKEQAFGFQCNILKTILQLETTFIEMAEKDKENVLIVCDRGAMDPSACEEREWRERERERMMRTITFCFVCLSSLYKGRMGQDNWLRWLWPSPTSRWAIRSGDSHDDSCQRCRDLLSALQQQDTLWRPGASHWEGQEGSRCKMIRLVCIKPC